MVTFQKAYDAVIARQPDKLYFNTNPAEFAQAIYLEMRRMDAEAIATKPTPAAKPQTRAERHDPAPPHVEATSDVSEFEHAASETSFE